MSETRNESPRLSGFLLNVLAGARAHASRTVATAAPAAALAAPAPAAATGPAECDRCRAVFGPIAYLADLLTYARSHLRDGGAPLGETFFGDRFHQPIEELPVSSEIMDTPVRQVRIAAEVLRGHLGTIQDSRTPEQLARLEEAERAYLLETYSGLLTRLGTSHRELRLAATADAATRSALAKRIGIDPQHLDALAFDPAELSEAALEQVFGLANTSREPLDPVPAPALRTWQRERLLTVWQAEDRAEPDSTTRTPIVDPDLIGEDDLAPDNPALELLQARRSEIEGELATLRQIRSGAASPLAGFDALLDRALGAGTADRLAALDARRRRGESIASDLEPLRLPLDAFVRLWEIHDLAAAGAIVTEAEWTEVESILAQVWKLGRFKVWRAVEKDEGIVLGPDHFRLAAPRTSPTPWRATAAARRRWQESLEARIERRERTATSLRGTVGAVEEATLPRLRDALIVATLDAGDPVTPEEQARWITDNLLIDARMSGSQWTTRLAQAIETVQGALFGVRTEQLRDTHPGLGLEAPAFDKEWEWIGSYAPWRSAMSVFLFPENLLLPSLRRRQTPAFRRLLSQVRSNRQLNPDAVRELASGYSVYFQDLCNLGVEACSTAAGGSLDRPLTYLFARNTRSAGPATRVYWSSYDPQADPAEARSFWEEVPGLTSVVGLLGATAYHPGGQRFVYLFASTQEDDRQRLVFTRYNLDTGVWNQEPVALDEPGDVTGYQFRMRATGALRQPHLLLQSKDGAAFFRAVSRKGTGWGPLDFAGIDCSPAEVPARYAASGDFDGDGREELLVAPDVGGTSGNDLWVLDLGSDGVWRHLSPIAGHGLGADLDCAAQDLAAKLVVVGDFDADGADEVVVFPDFGRGTWTPPEPEPEELVSVPAVAPMIEGELLPLPAMEMREDPGDGDGGGGGGGGGEVPDTFRADLWAFELQGGQWRRMSPLADHPFGAAIRCYRAGYAGDIGVAGDFDGDGRDEVAVSQANTNSFWVMAFRDSQWKHLSDPGYIRDLAFTCHPVTAGNPVIKARFAVAGDFDGDGRDEIAIAPLLGGTEGNDFWVMDYNPSTGRWSHLSRRQNHPFSADIDCHAEDLAAAFAVTGDFDGDGRDEIAVAVDAPGPEGNMFWVLRYSGGIWHRVGNLGNRFEASFATSPDSYRAKTAVVGDFDRDGRDEIAVLLDRGGSEGNDFRILDYDPGSGRWRPIYDLDASGSAVPARFAVAGDFDGDGLPEIAANQQATGSAGNDFWWLDAGAGFADPLAGCPADPVPVYGGPYALDERMSRQDLQAWRGVTEQTLLANPLPLRSCFEEAWYSVPVLLALQLQRQGHYTAALDWLQTVYDYSTQTKVYHGLKLEESPTEVYQRGASWLRDPLNPHAIAATRANTYSRYTLQTIVSCLLEFADSEFTRDTMESLPRARTLYMTALELLDVLRGTGPEGGPGDIVLALAAPRFSTPTLGEVLAEQSRSLDRIEAALLAEPEVARAAALASADPPWTPGLAALTSSTFCVPPNPVLQALELWAELNLFKLRNGRNIAGMERTLDPYAAPTDLTSGLARLGAGGQIVIPGSRPLRPTLYRYPVLMERARQLSGLAQQLESAFLATLEKREAEAYTLLKARQDVVLGHAGVRLSELRLKQAEGGVKLAELQLGRANIQAEYYQGLLEGGFSDYENRSLQLTSLVTWFHAGATVASAGAAALSIGEPGQALSALANSLSSTAAALSNEASILSILASYERRRQEWEFQRNLARQDLLIGSQQVRMADDAVRVATQERAITELQAQYAATVVEFLGSKFTSLELYDWMSGVLQDVYGFFLQQATAVARLAEEQLAFERQESPLGVIQANYWDLRDEDGSGPERLGITGSARLLRDLEQLDQHAFDTDRRKLQLTRTLSLMRLAPAEFQRFRETGVLSFETPMELFDRDFPGHYLRRIKRVRTSVIALIPPTQGIRATLSTRSVTSRIVVSDGAGFTTVAVPHLPQSVALTAPMNATGLFELDPQPEMLAPFEGLGVDTGWELSLPRAANLFDYSTIADVLVTLEYTALHSFTHRQNVVRELGDEISGDRPFSFRHQLADQWYDLHNPPAPDGAGTVRFTTGRPDFPPNLEDFAVQHVVLYFAGVDPARLLDQVVKLRYGSGEVVEASPAGGRIDTRDTAASEWARVVAGKAPFADWELSFPAEMRELFEDQEVDDLLFIVTYGARTAAWD